MSKKNDVSKKHKKSSFVEIVFYIMLSFVAFTCLLSTLISTMSFTNSQEFLKENFSDIGNTMKNYVQTVATIIDNNAVEVNAPAESENKNENSKSSDAKGQKKADADVVLNSETISELVKSEDKAIEYFEKVQEIQKEASANSVMSFIYSVLGAVLTAVGAALVAFIFKSKEMAEKARKDAEEVFKEADYVKTNMYIAIDEAEAAQKEAAQKAKEAEESFNNQEINNINSLNIQSVLIEIAYARFALIDFNNTDANDHFESIEATVFKIEKSYDIDWVKQLHNELCKLGDFVEKFKNDSFLLEGLHKKLDPDNIKYINSSIDTFKDAVERYCNTIDNAIKHCEKILDNHTED